MFDPTTWEAPYAVVLAALFVIVFCRTNATYWVGRAMASGAEHTRARRILSSPAYRRGAGWLNRWGAPAISVSFLTVGFQTMINLAAGVTRMPLRRYIPATIVGSIMWAFVYGTVGFVSFIALQRLWTLSPVAVVAIGLVVVAGAAWLLLSRDAAALPAEAEAGVEA